MKNQRILIIASFLLVLCVFEKEARNKAVRTGNVEKIYNIEEASDHIDPVLNQSELEVRGGEKTLYNLSPRLQYATMDTTNIFNSELMVGSLTK